MDGPARGGEVTLSKKQADDHQGSLRAYAEARLAKGAPARALTPADLLHEFQVHKIELKRQNEELRGAQAALEVARDRYQGLYDFAPVGYFSVGVNGLVEEVNLTGAAMLGEERGKVLGRRLAAFVAPEDGDRWALAFRSIVERDEKQTCEVRLRRKGGSLFVAALDCVRATGAAGPAVRIAFTDITERKRTEEVLSFLAQSIQSGGGDRFFGDLAGFLARVLHMDFVCIDRLEGDGLTAQTLAVWCDGAFQDNVAYALKDTPCGDVVGRDVCCFPASVCKFFPRDEVLLDLRAESYVGVTLWSHDGKPIGLIAVVGRAPLANPDVAASVLKLVTSRASNELERLETETSLRESETLFRNLFEGHAAAKLIIDPETGSVVDASQAAANFYGWSRDRLKQMRIQEISTLSPAEIAHELQRGKAKGGAHFEFRHRLADGSNRDVDVFTSKVSVKGRDLLHSNVMDSTARKRAESELLVAHAQLALTSRLAALGTLVAGVAHEINNPLAATLSDQELARGAVGELRDRLRGSGPLDRETEARRLDEVVEELDDAQDAGRRIERIVKDLKTFGRHDQTRARVRLIDIVELAMRWLPVTIGQTATVTVENGGAPDITASPGQIEQVVVNLVTNAAKATPEGKRGAIVVRIGPGKPGMARLDVVDHGKGIEPGVAARIFDPFFTKSDVEKGSGLGLSICHSIVTNHGGTLTATSEVGQGATFRAELPAG
jgi:PAS domain S-box-containing protein